MSTTTTDPPEHANIDWEAAERSPEFQALVKKRRSFVLPATVFFLVWYLGFILLAGYADFMGDRVYEGLTVGYTLALTQFAMVWILGIWYLKKADREFEPLEQAAAESARRMFVGATPSAAAQANREAARPARVAGAVDAGDGHAHA